MLMGGRGRRGYRRCRKTRDERRDGAEGADDVGGVAGVNDVGRDSGRDDSIVTGTAKDRCFCPCRCTRTVAAVDAVAAVATRR